MWEGFPASVGLVLVAEPAARLLFQHGQITAHDATLDRPLDRDLRRRDLGVLDAQIINRRTTPSTTP
jgi:hypothetical protein